MTSSYNTETDEIHLRPNASAYERFHELAHQEQWKGGAFWRCVVRLRGLRVNYLATLATEYDALRRARRVMRRLGIWNEEASNEAARMFSSYVKKKEI